MTRLATFCTLVCKFMGARALKRCSDPIGNLDTVSCYWFGGDQSAPDG